MKKQKITERKLYYEKILEENPNHFEALNFLGIIYAINREFEKSLNFFNKAIGINPNFSEVYYNKGNVLRELKQLKDAVDSYDKAISLNPNFAEAYCNRGGIFNELNLYDDAIISLEQSIKLNPNFAVAYNNLGNAFLKKNLLNEAFVNYEKAISFNSSFAEAYHNRGMVNFKLGDFNNSILDYQKAILIKPDYARAYSNLASPLFKLKRINDAINCYEKSLSINPDGDFIFGKLLYAKMHVANWSSFDANKKKLEENILLKKKVINPFEALSIVDDPKLQLIAAKTYSEFAYPYNNILGDFIKRNEKSDKIRIGYFSGDFYNHPVSYLAVELFEKHNREHFEVIGISYFQKKDKMRERLVDAFDQFFEVVNKSDLEIAKLSRELKIDIAIDLSGETENGRPGVFSYRAAPIQVSYLGYLGSTGSSCYDYLIADKIIIPESNKQFFSEKIIYLDSYQVNQSKSPTVKSRFTSSELGIPDKQFVFCCFNNIYKITPKTFDAWMQILLAVENSILFLYAKYDQVIINLKNEASIRGINPNRIIFGNRLNRDDYLSRFLNCDLFLDTCPYNAGATASDVLWSGLPLLTQVGESFASRYAASLLTALGISELITYSQNDYIAKAIDLANNPVKLQLIKNKLKKNKLNTTLFNTSVFTKNIEASYLLMHKKYLQNETVEDIEI